MKYDKLGKTNIEVSKICLGTMTFGLQNSEAEGHEQMDYALEKGINFFDTAEMYPVPGTAERYGHTESVLGTWFKKTGKRDKVILASKVTGPSPYFSSYMRPNLNFSEEHIDEALENSLKRLQTDYIDLYQLHWPERKTNFFGQLGYKHDENDPWEDNIHEVLKTLEKHVRAGKIRYIGLSNETAWGMHRFLQLSQEYDLPRIVSVQNPYNLLNRTYEVGCAEISIREECGLLPYSPLAFGILSGKYLHGKMPKNSRMDLYGNKLSRYNGSRSTASTERYQLLADKYGMSLAQFSLAFINSQPFVTSNIIGATNLEQLQENIESINVEFTDEMLADVEEIHNEIPYPAP